MEKPQWFSVLTSGLKGNFRHESNWNSFESAEIEAKLVKRNNPDKRVIITDVIAEIVEIPQPQFETKHYS